MSEAFDSTMDTEGCPSPDDMLGFVERRLDARAHGCIVRHVDRCSTCRRWVAHLTSLGVGDGGEGLAAAKPISVLGRYALEEEIGRGAMGVVYLARDPQLDREVAIKLIEHHGDDVHGRVLREARAMARVQHPNVVGVLDFGRMDDVFFVVMELVRGHTLREWQRGGRAWQDVVDAYVQAARGLSAAHRCGVVHRDFKPANVLVGEDGIVRVTDFGLARGPGCQVEITEAAEPAPRELTKTTTGALIGTLAYMAPEQLEGRGATVQADQFSLCVALWEGLSGRRPFEGATPEELLEAMRRGPPMSVAPRVPRHVSAALRQGLALVPSRRHRSVDDLISALTRRRRTMTAVATGLGVSAVLASVLALPHLRSSSASDALDERRASAPMSTLDPATREALRDQLDQAREAVREDGLGEGAQACERLQADVEARGDAALQAEAQVVCSDVHLARGEIGQAGAKLESAYFEARAAGADAVALEASTRRLLVALFEEGDYALAERWLAHAEAELERTDDPRLAALTARAAASLWAFRGELDRAFEAVERGAEAARSGGLEALEILLLEEQANLLRSQLRHDEALVLYEDLARRVDALNADPFDTLPVQIGLGRTLVEAGFFEEGLAQLDGIVGILATPREHGDRVWAAEVADLRGNALQHLGRSTEARAAHVECMRTLEETGGAFIPLALICQTEVFAIDASLGRCETIASDLDRHVDTVSHRLGPEHADTSHARVWNGYCRLVTGQIDHARSELHMVLDAFADAPLAPSARLARALLDAEHWGLPVESVLERGLGPER